MGKHYLENPELLEALMKWHKDEGDLKKSKGDEIKASLRANRGNLIPIDGISKQKRRSLKECVQEWNKTAQGRKCRLTYDNTVGESNGWSDRKLAKRKGHVTGLEVKTIRDWVCQVRARYGTSWTSWRQVGPDWTMATNQEKFTLLLDGWIEMIKVETNEEEHIYGDRTTYLQPGNDWKEESPNVEGARLSHLSGNSTKGAIELCFHWVVPKEDVYDA